MAQVATLKGKPVVSMLRGQFPNKALIQQILADHPHCTALVEHRSDPCVFVITLREWKKH